MSATGIYADSYQDLRSCGQEYPDGETCPFYGDVEVFFDPVAEYETWECPLCAVKHEAPWSGMHYYCWDDDQFGDWEPEKVQ